PHAPIGRRPAQLEPSCLPEARWRAVRPAGWQSRVLSTPERHAHVTGGCIATFRRCSWLWIPDLERQNLMRFAVVNPHLLSESAQQRGVFTSLQAQMAGYSVDEILSKVRAGKWRALRRGVYTTTDTFEKAR